MKVETTSGVTTHGGHSATVVVAIIIVVVVTLPMDALPLPADAVVVALEDCNTRPDHNSSRRRAGPAEGPSEGAVVVAEGAVVVVVVVAVEASVVDAAGIVVDATGAGAGVVAVMALELGAGVVTFESGACVVTFEPGASVVTFEPGAIVVIVAAIVVMLEAFPVAIVVVGSHEHDPCACDGTADN